MKRVHKRSAEPSCLRDYRNKNPDRTWKAFRRTQCHREKVKPTIYSDQKGLCAYCESKIQKPTDEQDQNDFQVEHFHPKSDSDSVSQSAPHNWDLDWENLLGVCCGGSDKKISEGGDHSCGTAKQNEILDDVILNPLKIPAFPALFEYDKDGHMKVNKKKCPNELQAKATNSITKLRLANGRLNRARKAVFDQLQEEIKKEMSNNQPYSPDTEDVHFHAAIKTLAKVYLGQTQSDWPEFFSCIRFQLGKEAEEVLESIGYENNC